MSSPTSTLTFSGDARRRRLSEAWLSRLDAPGAWGGGAKGGVSAVVAPPEILADLTTACDLGAQTACEELSLEEEAKLAWLESLGPAGVGVRFHTRGSGANYKAVRTGGQARGGRAYLGHGGLQEAPPRLST